MEALRSAMPSFLGKQNKPCCHAKQQKQMLRILDTVYRVALVALCALVCPVLTAYALGIGAGLSATVIVYEAAQFGTVRSSGTILPVCGQGYMEYLSGRRFPQWMVHTVTSSFIGAHVLHFPAYFVPFVSGFVGWWAGAEVTSAVVSLSQRVVHLAGKHLLWVIIGNLLLTVVQILGGIVSGSLALLSDALHNFSDAGSLVVAWFADRISHRAPDTEKTFGYQRAQTVGALINLIALMIVGFYLIMEAIHRVFAPESIHGQTVIVVALVALIVDLVTAYVTYVHSDQNLNFRAVFIHNLSDALSSVAVLIGGVAAWLYGWYWVDTLAAVLIAVYILWQSARLLPQAIHILMDGAPPELDQEQLEAALVNVPAVQSIHHVHVWFTDERTAALEAHIVLDKLESLSSAKKQLKAILQEQFGIDHSTLEFETEEEVCQQQQHQ